MLGSIGYFEQAMTAGRVFISLAAMIFGKYTPIGSFGAGLLLDFLNHWRPICLFSISGQGWLLLMLPYVITMVVLAGGVGAPRTSSAVCLTKRNHYKNLAGKNHRPFYYFRDISAKLFNRITIASTFSAGTSS